MYVVITVGDDGTIDVHGTRSGGAISTQAAADRLADLLRDEENGVTAGSYLIGRTVPVTI